MGLVDISEGYAVEEVRADLDQFDEKIARLESISQRLLQGFTHCSATLDTVILF
jgi:hypothetical protein